MDDFQDKVKLKISGQSVDYIKVPEYLLDSFTLSFKELEDEDPFAILVTYSYVFCGLRINDLKDMIILTDRNGARKASREYIRQKIVNTFSRIRDNYINKHGRNSISPLFRQGNLETTGVSFIEEHYNELFEEEDLNEKSSEEVVPDEPHINQEEEPGVTEVKEERPRTYNNDRRDSHGGGPRDSETWLVSIKNIFRGKRSI